MSPPPTTFYDDSFEISLSLIPAHSLYHYPLQQYIHFFIEREQARKNNIQTYETYASFQFPFTSLPIFKQCHYFTIFVRGEQSTKKNTQNFKSVYCCVMVCVYKSDNVRDDDMWINKQYILHHLLYIL